MALRLMQDIAFQQAVQTSHLQAAAKAAISLLGVGFVCLAKTSTLAATECIPIQHCYGCLLLSIACCECRPLLPLTPQTQAPHQVTLTLGGETSKKATGDSHTPVHGADISCAHTRCLTTSSAADSFRFTQAACRKASLQDMMKNKVSAVLGHGQLCAGSL